MLQPCGDLLDKKDKKGFVKKGFVKKDKRKAESTVENKTKKVEKHE